MLPAPSLSTLDTTPTKLSDLLENANLNYGKYHELAAKYSAWQTWYMEQQKLFDGE